MVVASGFLWKAPFEEPLLDDPGHLVAVRFKLHRVRVAMNAPVLQPQMLDVASRLGEEIDHCVVVGGHPARLGGDDDDRHAREIGQASCRFLLHLAGYQPCARRRPLLPFERVAFAERRVIGERRVGDAEWQLAAKRREGRPERLCGDQRPDELRPRVGDQPAGWAAGGMGQEDGRADKIEKLGAGPLGVLLALHRIGESGAGAGKKMAERGIVDGAVAGPFIVQACLGVIVPEA